MMWRHQPVWRRLYIAALALIAHAMLTLAIMCTSQWMPSGIPLPLAVLDSVAVDSQGRIYCVSRNYGRVQVYSPNGKYLRGWPVRSLRHYQIRVNVNDEVEVDWVGTYSSEGRLLRERPYPAGFVINLKRDGTGPYTKCIDTEGRIYSIRHPMIYPHVVRLNNDGTTAVAVAPPRLGWLIMGPFPFFGFAAMGMLLLGLANHLYRRERIKEGSKKD